MSRILCCSLTRFYFCKFLTLVVIATFLYVFFKTIESFNNGSKLRNLSPWAFSSVSDQSENIIDIDDVGNNQLKGNSHASSLLHDEFKKSCPICLGETICDNVDIGALKVERQLGVQNGKLIYEGTWHKTTKVIVKVVNKDLMNDYKKFLCYNMTKKSECASHQLPKSLDKNLFAVKNVRNVHKITSRQQSEIPAVLCTTEKLVAHFKTVYDLDNDGSISDQELLNLHTCLSTDSESLIHMFLSKSSINLPIPYLFGICGQVLVIEGAFKPLKSFMDDGFAIRAGFAVQILQIVEDFLEEDPDWMFMFSDFSFDNIAVKDDGDVILTDVANVAIIDKSLSKPDVKKVEDENVCNEVCYRRYTSDLYYSSDRNKACARISHISHMMYALVCRNILSDLDEHAQSLPSNSSKGLLHSIPERDKQTLEDLLQECVKETSAGGRLQAAEELKDLLGEYVADEDLDVNDTDFEDEDVGANGE